MNLIELKENIEDIDMFTCSYMKEKYTLQIELERVRALRDIAAALKKRK